MRRNEWEECGRNTLPGAPGDAEEQLRVIIYCMGRLRALIEDEENEAERKQLSDLEQLLLLWMRRKAEGTA